MSSFKRIFNESPVVLTGGPIVERLKREFELGIDYSNLSSLELIYTQPKLLEALNRQYIDVAEAFNLPILILTAITDRQDENLKKSKFKDRNITSDVCDFINTLKLSYKSFSNKILIGGSLGCKGDAYSGKQIMTKEEAYKFHSIYTSKFKTQNIDFLFANIMPELNETIGMAKAMSETELPYIISFMIRKNGRLLDGTPIADAIKIIDESVSPKPFCYMTNCIHPKNLRLALTNPINKNRSELQRFKGLKSNASSLSPEELDGCNVVHREGFDEMINDMLWLKNNFNLKILGGCCGTNNIFASKLSKALKGDINDTSSVNKNELTKTYSQII